jgi:DNA-binding transcriptional LysR family regulator
MSKRLQVVIQDTELRLFRRAARRAGMTLSEWVRQTLRNAERRVAVGDPESKLEAIRVAVGHQFPAPDIDQMLDEIESGYPQDAD